MFISILGKGTSNPQLFKKYFFLSFQDRKKTNKKKENIFFIKVKTLTNYSPVICILDLETLGCCHKITKIIMEDD